VSELAATFHPAQERSRFPFDSFPLRGQSLRAGSRLRRSFALRMIFFAGMTDLRRRWVAFIRSSKECKQLHCRDLAERGK